MSSTKSLASVLVLVFGVNLSICKPVWSQEQRSTVDDTLLDDVVELPEVTVFGAARDGRDLLDTPSAVTVIDGAEMDRLQPSAHGGLMGDTPGVVIQGGRGVAQEPNIRGFQDEQVVVRVDGARQNFDLQHRGRFFVDLIMLKQVEVLRGGASTMFGSGALGGVISLDTKDASDILKPGETWGSEVNVGFHGQGSEALRAITGAVQKGDVSMLAFFSQRLMYIDLVDGDDNPILDSAVDNLNGMFKLSWEPNSDQEILLDWRIYVDDGQVPNTANRDTVDADLRESRLVDRDLNHQQYRFKWNYMPFNNNLVNLSTLIYYNSTRSEERRVSLLSGENKRRLDTTDISTVGAEITNLSDFHLGRMPVTLAYGLEFFKDDHKATRNGEDRLESPTAQRSLHAGFAQADFMVHPEITLSSGLRYDTFNLNPPDHHDPEKNFSQRDESALSPWLALNWQPSDSLQFFTSVSQAFRAPTLTEIYAQGTHFRIENAGQIPNIGRDGRPMIDPVTRRPIMVSFDIDNQFMPNPDLQSEKATQMEIGIRYQRSNVAMARDQLLLSANAYYSAVDNYIETYFPEIGFTSPMGPGNATINTGTATRNVNAVLYGFEAEMAYDSPSWFTSANLTIPRGSEHDSSQQLGNIPQDRLSVTVGLKPGPKWEIGLRSTVAGERDVSDADGDLGFADTESFATFDLFANLRLSDNPSSDVLVSFGVDNITNQKYKLHPNVLNSPGRSVKLGTRLTF